MSNRYRTVRAQKAASGSVTQGEISAQVRVPLHPLPEPAV